MLTISDVTSEFDELLELPQGVFALVPSVLLRRTERKRRRRQMISLTAHGLGGSGAPGSFFWVVSESSKNRVHVSASHLPVIMSL